MGEQIVRLIAMFAMHLMGAERERLKLFSFDEGWRLLGDPVGRTLLASLQRMGRSELAVPIISTQLVTDTLVGERESLENLIGATFVFGMRSEAEAARALALLGLDPEDARDCASACSSSTPGAACFATTPGAWRRSRSMWWCRRCCARFSTTPPREGEPHRQGESRPRASGDAPRAARCGGSAALAVAPARGARRVPRARAPDAGADAARRSAPAAQVPAGRGEEAEGSAPAGEADPLVSNGLGSPLCTACWVRANFRAG